MKILFVTLGDFSNINSSLRNELLRHFKEDEVEFLNVKEGLRKNYLTVFIGFMAVLTEYAGDFIAGRKSLSSIRKYFYHTPFILNYFNKRIAAFLKPGKYHFVFQTQSLFDSSSDHTPNFLYIDHTNLNNLNYPMIQASEYLCSKRYVERERIIYLNATRVFVMSRNMKDSLVNQYNIAEEKIDLVYVGSNTRISGEVDRTKYANKNILFVGVDWERKGGPLLVDAFKMVQQQIPDATLTVIGCSPRINVKNCNVLGKLPLDEVSAHYNRASVFCLPTKREPFGVVFIEAMLNRLAVVTNDMGATPELVVNGKNGYRLHHDAKEYAYKLVSLLNNPRMCEEFGEYSYELAREKYSWQNVGELISSGIRRAISPQAERISS